MPTYRRAAHITQTIRSVQSSSLRDFELLVRDDGNGDDGTPEAVAAAATGDPRIRYWRNPRNLGMPRNLNGGISEARGDFIAVCHDHDLYAPTFLEAMVAALNRHPTALFAHCAIEVVDERGACIGTHRADWPELTPGRNWIAFMLTRFDCPVCALTLVRRSAHEQFGLYDSTYGFIADVEMWMRLSLHGDVAYVGEPLLRVRARESDHFIGPEFVAVSRTAANIHRKYIKLAYSGSEQLMRRSLMEWRLVRRLTKLWAIDASHRFRDVIASHEV